MNGKKTAILCLRILMLLAGPALLGFSIACLYWAGLGADPTSVLADGVHVRTGWQHSLSSNAVNLFLLLLLLCLDRKKAGIATVVCAVFTGPFIGLFQHILFFRLPPPGFFPGLLFVATAAAVNNLGLGIYLSAGFGSSAFDGLILCLREKTGFSYKAALWLFYAVVFLLGAALGGVWGVGTLLTLALGGPCFQFFYGRLSAWSKRTLNL